MNSEQTSVVDLDPEQLGENPCFGCRQDHPVGFRLRFARVGDAVETRFTPTENYQGPPGIMHGGLVTTLADEIAAWTVIGLRERFGFTASLEARWMKPVRLGEEVRGVGRIANETRRLLTLEVELWQNDEVAFRGTFRFALLDEAGAERLLGRPLPDAWKRLAR